jgi:hypothetical protein
MKRPLAVFLLAAGFFWVRAAEARDVQASPARSQAVPVTVRVFDGGTFVPDLRLEDFELVESGLMAKPRALYLLRKNVVERREGETTFNLNLTRRISLVFQVTDYNSRIAEAIQELFRHGLVAGDTLEILTPMGTYGLGPERLAAKPREVLALELIDIVRKDIIRANMGYNSLLRDLRRIVRQIGGGGRTGLSDTEGEFDDGTSLEQLIMGYTENLQQFERMRALNEQALLKFGLGLKARPGLRTVYYFYQREFRPEIDSKTVNMLLLANQDRQDILASIQTAFGMYNRDIFIDHERLRRTFADSGATFNLLFMNKAPERISGITMHEQSEDVFKALALVAAATGGITDSSQNPAASMKTALAASDPCYILFFTPSVAAPPGTFADIEIRVKRGSPKVVFRAGYFFGP